MLIINVFSQEYPLYLYSYESEDSFLPSEEEESGSYSEEEQSGAWDIIYFDRDGNGTGK